MSLLLDISTVTKISREYTGVIIINFPEMDIVNRVFTFIANTPEDAPPGAVIFKDSLPLIFFQLKENVFVWESEVNYGARTDFISGFFFEAIKLGVMSIVDFVRQNQTLLLGYTAKINLPVSRSVIWEVENQSEALHGVICLVCGKEKWLEKI
ncbi:MAG: hypothetical protein Q8Q95_01290 [bacterium]|nr:hypothetical protein [bacterium]